MTLQDRHMRCRTAKQAEHEERHNCWIMARFSSPVAMTLVISVVVWPCNMALACCMIRCRELVRFPLRLFSCAFFLTLFDVVAASCVFNNDVSSALITCNLQKTIYFSRLFHEFKNIIYWSVYDYPMERISNTRSQSTTAIYIYIHINIQCTEFVTMFHDLGILFYMSTVITMKMKGFDHTLYFEILLRNAER